MNPPTLLAAVAASLLAAAGASAQHGAPPARAPGVAPHTIDGAGAVAATLKQGPNCQAYAPAGWVVAGTRPQGDAFDLTSSDRSLYAGWGIRGVNRAMEGYYGPLYGDPEPSSLAVVRATLQAMGEGGDVHYSAAAQALGAGFLERKFESPRYKGLIVFRTYPAPPGLAPGSYIISLRIAAGDRRAWDASGERVAAGVMVSIRCTTMFKARNDGPIALPRPGDRFAKKKGDETDDLADYNAQLGTQWVHSPSTGQMYMVDAAAAWNENGPDGPGYYRKAGNSYEKLAPGASPP